MIDEDNGGTIDGEEFVSFLEGSRDVNILPHEEKRLQVRLLVWSWLLLLANDGRRLPSVRGTGGTLRP